MTYLLKGYGLVTMGNDEDTPIVTFESNCGPFTVGPGYVTSLNYDDREIVWLRYDEKSHCWYMDADDLGFPPASLDDRYIWVKNFVIEHKPEVHIPVDLKDKLDQIDLRLLTLLNWIDVKKAQDEQTLARIRDHVDMETAVEDIIHTYQDTVPIG